mgnify:CR=1 FL=1
MAHDKYTDFFRIFLKKVFIMAILPLFAWETMRKLLDYRHVSLYNVGSYGNFYPRKGFELWQRNLKLQACGWPIWKRN